MDSKKLIIGLGNPEPEYSGTRHNIGKDILKHIFVEKDLSENDSELRNNFIIKSPNESYMNDIGGPVAKLINFYKTDLVNVAIIYDELDLLAGEYKMTFGRGSKIHNGIRSIQEQLGSINFWHIRIGVREESIPGVSVQKAGRDPAKYVLAKIPKEDNEKIIKMAKTDLSADLSSWISKASKNL